MSERTTLLDRVYQWESTLADRVWLTQPVGGGAVVDYTWKSAMSEARRMAAHLGSLPRGSTIAIVGKNTAHWLLADLAIWMAGHVSVPVYPTLTAETVRQILEHSEAKLVFIGKLDAWDTMKDGVPDGVRCVALPLAPKTDFETWESIVERTEPLTTSPTRDPDELATIVYTSGSTGVPKGVMLSFGAMVAGARGFAEILSTGPEDRMLSYLPLAHAFERAVVEAGTFYNAFHIFFAESLETFVADLKRARPTLFVSVPRLWLKFHQGVVAKVPARKLDRMLSIPIVSYFVRRKVLRGLGLDHVRVAASGSAPIPPELLDWYRRLGLELLEGYGMTENISYSHVSRPGAVRVGYVGSPAPGVEVRLSEAGEVQVKSPGVMMGYYKAPELTKEVITDDGFLCTGDRGEIDAQGRLKLTGRVKELFKTSKGKYVAPAPIENMLLTSELLESACVTGHGMPQPYAVVTLSEVARKDGVDDGVRERIGTELARHLAEINRQLDPHEALELIAIAAGTWQIDNGLLTPTMKIKRAAIEQLYNPQAEGWYARREKVIWESAAAS